MSEEKCPKCDNLLEENEDLTDGMCESCYEVDDTPTSEECDQCEQLATTNICGTDLCDDCLEHYHY